MISADMSHELPAKKTRYKSIIMLLQKINIKDNLTVPLLNFNEVEKSVSYESFSAIENEWNTKIAYILSVTVLFYLDLPNLEV